MTILSLPGPRRSFLRFLGVLLAIASVILPAVLRGPIFAQPPLPLAALWAAYGWAAEEEGEARGSHWAQHLMALRAPIGLAVLGLIQDQLSGGPLGLMTAIYLSAFLIGRVVSVVSTPELVPPWVGFFAMAALSVAIASGLSRWALGPNESVHDYMIAAIITAVLFPFVRPLYMDAAPGARAQVGRSASSRAQAAARARG